MQTTKSREVRLTSRPKGIPTEANFTLAQTQLELLNGLLVLDWLDRQAESEAEVGGYYRAGNLKHRETVGKGIDQAVGAFVGLFHGQNVREMGVELT